MRTQTQKILGSAKAESVSSQKSFTPQYSHPALQLQSQIGNQAVQRLLHFGRIQAKLTVGQPNDKYEQEADRVADQVIRMPDPTATEQGPKNLSNQIPVIQRMCPECEQELQRQPADEIEEEEEKILQRQPMEDEEEELLQAKEIPGQTPEVSNEVESTINNLRGGGQPLSFTDRSFFEPRFGQDFSKVRIHTNSQAAKMVRSINAHAFTLGHDVVFGAGQYSPKTSAGKKLVAHELTHVVQQKGRPQGLGISSRAHLTVQRKPRQVRAHRFLGMNVLGGVNPRMASRLNNVAVRLRRDYQTAHGRAAANDTVVRNWAGIYSMRGWRQRRRPSNSKHCSGSAVDVNYDNQPYIVTRSQVRGREVLGGERAGRHLTAQRQVTVDVFDRAKEFVFGRINISAYISIIIPFPFLFIPVSYSLPNRADVSKRRTGESTGDVFDRFKQTSNTLGTYLGLAFHTAPTTVRRQPIRNIERVSERALLRAIPTIERKAEAVGIAAIQSYIRAHLTTVGRGSAFHFSIGDIARARDFYFRMLRDYEHVRIPMVRGAPVARPRNTRNPARGFLDMSRYFVVAMADVGRLRWGIADLGVAESGDTHHFDLGNHGGVRPDCLP